MSSSQLIYAPQAQSKSQAVSTIQRCAPLLLLAILLLAAAERILHIGDQSMWLDEGFAYFNQKQPDMIHWLSIKELHPPLYFWGLHLWIGLTGSSAVAMRMFSALPSLLSVAAVVPLAKALARDKGRDEYWSIPLIAALLMALNDSEISLAQDVRMYALRTLLVLLSFLFYVRWYKKPGLARALLWVAALVTLYHTHYQGLYVPAIIGLHALIFLRGRRRVAALGWLALSGVLFAPWFLTIGWNQRGHETGMLASLPSNWTTAVELGFKYFSQMWSLMIGLLLLGLFRWVDGRVQWRPLGSTFLLATWLVFSVVVTFIGNLWFDILSPRRLMLVTPALSILTARGLANFKNPARVFLVAVIVIYGLATVDDYYPKVPWNALAYDMARYAETDQLVLMEIYRDDVTMDYYVDYLLSPQTPRESLRLWREDRASEYPDRLIAEIDAQPTVWLVHWSPDQSAFHFLADTGHVQTAKMSVPHINGIDVLDVYRFDRLPPVPVAQFTNGMTLRQFEILPDEGRVDLWWSADAPLDKDYTVSAFVLDAGGQLVAQFDGYPFQDFSPRPTTTFQPGEVVYDPHPINWSELPSGQYTVAVQLYTWQDQVKYPPVGSAAVSSDGWLVLGTLARP